MNQSDHRNESTRGHDTFGVSAVAAARLQRLADLFRPPLVNGHARVAWLALAKMWKGVTHPPKVKPSTM